MKIARFLALTVALATSIPAHADSPLGPAYLSGTGVVYHGGGSSKTILALPGVCTGSNFVSGISTSTGQPICSAPPGAGGLIANNITGLLPSSISGNSTTGSVTISSGRASDSTYSTELTGAGYSWSVSNGNAINGYQGGTTLPSGQTIHFFLCTGGSGTGSFASLSVTPTCPTGYTTYYRRIFSLLTNGSGALVSGVMREKEGGASVFFDTVQTTDINAATPTSASRTSYPLNVPTGIQVTPLGRFLTTNSAGCIVSSPDEPDTAPGGTPTTISDSQTGYGGGIAPAQQAGLQFGFELTNTSGQIGVRCSSASGAISWFTRGWIDNRRS